MRPRNFKYTYNYLNFASASLLYITAAITLLSIYTYMYTCINYIL
jgi:hypothetical protein